MRSLALLRQLAQSPPCLDDRIQKRFNNFGLSLKGLGRCFVCKLSTRQIDGCNSKVR